MGPTFLVLLLFLKAVLAHPSGGAVDVAAQTENSEGDVFSEISEDEIWQLFSSPAGEETESHKDSGSINLKDVQDESTSSQTEEEKQQNDKNKTENVDMASEASTGTKLGAEEISELVKIIMPEILKKLDKKETPPPKTEVEAKIPDEDQTVMEVNGTQVEQSRSEPETGDVERVDQTESEVGETVAKEESPEESKQLLSDEKKTKKKESSNRSSKIDEIKERRRIRTRNKTYHNNPSSKLSSDFDDEEVRENTRSNSRIRNKTIRRKNEYKDEYEREEEDIISDTLRVIPSRSGHDGFCKYDHFLYGTVEILFSDKDGDLKVTDVSPPFHNGEFNRLRECLQNKQDIMKERRREPSHDDVSHQLIERILSHNSLKEPQRWGDSSKNVRTKRPSKLSATRPTSFEKRETLKNTKVRKLASLLERIKSHAAMTGDVGSRGAGSRHTTMFKRLTKKYFDAVEDLMDSDIMDPDDFKATYMKDTAQIAKILESLE